MVIFIIGVTIGIFESLTFFKIVDYRLILNTLGDEPWRNPHESAGSHFITYPSA